MYVDLYFSKNSVKIEEYNVLGMSALQVAMKIEEVELVPINPQAYPFSHEYTLAQYERKILQTLNFKLFPDTLYNWVDYLIEKWDSFVANHELDTNTHFFKSFVDI